MMLNLFENGQLNPSFLSTSGEEVLHKLEFINLQAKLVRAALAASALPSTTSCIKIPLVPGTHGDTDYPSYII